MTEKLDRTRNEQVAASWGIRVIAYHMLGEHQRELELAQEAHRLFPGDMEVLTWEAYALVGLGRLAEVNAVVDAMARLPEAVQQEKSLWFDLEMIGSDLRAHGYRDEAQAVFERGIRWIEVRPAAEQRNLRFELYRLLYAVERYDEARQILKQLAAETPDDVDAQATLGAVAARRGDLKEVARIDRWLAGRTSRYHTGQRTFNRARLAAILGDRNRAVELYRQALDQGWARHAYDGFGIHGDPDFESLRDYPPFQELTRPKD